MPKQPGGTLSLLLGAAMLAGAAPAREPDRCAALSFANFPVCKATTGGVILAGTQADADLAASAAAEGERRFEAHFGPPARYAIVVGDFPAGLRQRLAEAGYPVVLPWLTAAARHQALEASVRRATEARLENSGMTAEQKQAAVATALAQVRGRQGDRLLTSYSAVAHELGHMWLIQLFWGDRAAAKEAGPGHYGGPAPDWLDEAAAIAMEDDMLTAPRRNHFHQMANGGAAGGIAPLESFFAMAHPLARVSELARSGAAPGGGGTSQIMVLSGEEVQRRLGVGPKAGPNFYAQSRVVADFLLDRSGNPKILAEVARSLAGGATIEQWLAASGAANRLEPTLAGLERQWQTWIDGHYRSTPPAP